MMSSCFRLGQKALSYHTPLQQTNSSLRPMHFPSTAEFTTQILSGVAHLDILGDSPEISKRVVDQIILSAGPARTVKTTTHSRPYPIPSPLLPPIKISSIQDIDGVDEAFRAPSIDLVPASNTQAQGTPSFPEVVDIACTCIVSFRESLLVINGR